MTNPVRIQRKRTKGYDMQAESRAVNGLECVYVGRPGKFGNPYIVGKTLGVKTNEMATELFSEMHLTLGMEDDIYPSEEEIKQELRGKNLACWCPLPTEPDMPDMCHAAVLLEIANKD